MKLHHIDNIFHKIILVLIIISAILIISELVLPLKEETIELFDNIDRVIVLIFIADLILEYHKIKNVKKFLKTCWLDIIAVFPFSDFLRMLKISRLLRPILKAEEVISKAEKLGKANGLVHLKHVEIHKSKRES